MLYRFFISKLKLGLMKSVAMCFLAAVLLSACQRSPPTVQSERRTDSFDVLSAVRPEILSAFNERPLSKAPTDSAVRIFYIPTFDHPFMIRHSISGKSGSNRAVVLSGKGGYDPGTICFESSSDSSLGQVTYRLSQLDKIGFWASPSAKADSGSDGAVYLIEVVENGQYRGWKRWSPGHEEALNLFLLGEILNEGLIGVTCKEV